MFPKRGALAAGLTSLMLVLLLNFKTPAAPTFADQPQVADPPAESSLDVAAADSTTAGNDPSTSAGPDAGSSSTAGSSATGSSATAGGSTTTGLSPTPGATGAAKSTTPAKSAAPGATTRPTTAPVVTPKPATPPPPASTPTPKPLFTGSLDGTTVQTPFGPMQVRVVYSAGRITDVITLQATNRDSKSVSLSAHACPILRSEALSAQSAKINTVSGATYTSNGYKTSLQAAISKKPY